MNMNEKKKNFEAVFSYIWCEYPEPSEAVKLKWWSMFGHHDKDLLMAAAKQLAKLEIYGLPKSSDFQKAITSLIKKQIPAGLLDNADAAEPEDNELTERAWEKARRITVGTKGVQYSSPEDYDRAKFWAKKELRKNFVNCLKNLQERATQLIDSGRPVREAIDMVVNGEQIAIGEVGEMVKQIADKKAINQ
jgi:hypothetical protein